MKNLLKSLGAAIGYLALYLAVTFTVAFANVIGYLVTHFSLGKALEFVMSRTGELSIISCLFTLIICILIQRFARKRNFMDYLEIRPVVLKRLWPVFILGISLNIVIVFLLNILPLPRDIMDDYSKAVGALSEDSSPVTLIFAVIVAPVFEEILYRGLIFNALMKGMPVWAAVVLQAVMFGVSHVQIVWMSYAFALGIVLALIRLRYKSLIAPMGVHFALNGLSGLMVATRFDMGSSAPLYYSIVAAAFLLAGLSAWFIHRYTKADPQPVPESE